MSRRTFLLAGAAAAGLAGLSLGRRWLERPDIHIDRPGMADGHWLREHAANLRQPPTETLDTQIAILGSGVAGLSCAWQLARSGRRDFVMVQGPERDGNCAAGQLGDLAHPLGAHYLPLPSLESHHVRAMLHDIGILEGSPQADSPTYDERAIVHAPIERLLKDGRWHDELLPTGSDTDPTQAAQHLRFQAWMQSLSHAVGLDGNKAFAMPRFLSSSDPRFTALDTLTMKHWLSQNGFDSTALQWYCDYACRDDYGIGYDQTSAWAGIHYFAARAGRAANAEAGAVLTWPDGLGALVQKLRAHITKSLPPNATWTMNGLAAKVQQHASGADTWVIDPGIGRSVRLRARHVVLAMPLMVAARILEGAEADFGLTAKTLPEYAPWLVGNVRLEGLPNEQPGSPLSWDNVVYQSPALGYVLSTHQQLRRAPPQRTVLTTYRCLNNLPAPDARRWLAEASPEALWQHASEDLRMAYPSDLMRHVREVSVTLRAHAMSSPRPGFLSDPSLTRARRGNQRVHFAHADLSGLSVFEEASYWGCEVAKRLL